jgi:hypothetical protein
MIRKQVGLSDLHKILQPIEYHMELSWADTLKYWVEKIIIRHFNPGNDIAYGYPALDPKYLARKQKKYGNQPMLVASGVLRESVISMYKIYKVKGRFRVVLQIPKYGKYVALIRDFTLVNKRDKNDLMRYFKRDYEKRRHRFVSSISIKRR